MSKLMRQDGYIGLSRRGLKSPEYRITRSTSWSQSATKGGSIDPWHDKAGLPLLGAGVLGELIYGDQPVIFNDFTPDPADPGYEHFKEARSLMAMPLFDGGEGLNMAVQFRRVPGGYREDDLPGNVWMSNLFGRATHNLVLSRDLERTQAALDKEIRQIADMQRSLLSTDLPTDYGLDLAYHWEPSSMAGGDFFNALPLEDGSIGLFIGDVSGHGVAAAVLTAISHAIVHTAAEPPNPPGRIMQYLNGHLCRLYTKATAQFITAWYGVYDPSTRKLCYSSAGHPPPRVVNGCGGDNLSLDGGRNLPLGIMDAEYEAAEVVLGKGDVLVLYTDGITEARPDRQAELYGVDRLDRVLETCGPDPDEIIRRITRSVNDYTKGEPVGDDQTLLVAKVR
jgi:sigma-B regulation protein RsbU (phosphoserine phosphatase)